MMILEYDVLHTHRYKPPIPLFPPLSLSSPLFSPPSSAVSQPDTLFQMVKATLKEAAANGGDNSIIAFHDNSSAIQGYVYMSTCYTTSTCLHVYMSTPRLHEWCSCARFNPSLQH